MGFINRTAVRRYYFIVKRRCCRHVAQRRLAVATFALYARSHLLFGMTSFTLSLLFLGFFTPTPALSAYLISVVISASCVTVVSLARKTERRASTKA